MDHVESSTSRDIYFAIPGSPTHPNTIPSLEETSFDNISVQDILTSGMGFDESEKIQQKIIETITQYASDCPTYEKILMVDLPAEGFEFPKHYIPVNVDLGSCNATGKFHGIRIFESSVKRKSYSTSIECQSTRMAKVSNFLYKNLKKVPIAYLN